MVTIEFRTRKANLSILLLFIGFFLWLIGLSAPFNFPTSFSRLGVLSDIYFIGWIGLIIFYIGYALYTISDFSPTYKCYIFLFSQAGLLATTFLAPFLHGSIGYDHDTYRNIAMGHFIRDFKLDQLGRGQLRYMEYVQNNPLSFLIHFLFLQLRMEFFLIFLFPLLVFVSNSIYSMIWFRYFNSNWPSLKQMSVMNLFQIPLGLALGLIRHPSPQLWGFFILPLVIFPYISLSNENTTKKTYLIRLTQFFGVFLLFLTHYLTTLVAIYLIVCFELLNLFSHLSPEKIIRIRQFVTSSKIIIFAVPSLVILLVVGYFLPKFLSIIPSFNTIPTILNIEYMIDLFSINQFYYFLLFPLIIVASFMIIISIISLFCSSEIILKIKILIPLVLSSVLFISSQTILEGAFGGRWLLFGLAPTSSILITCILRQDTGFLVIEKCLKHWKNIILGIWICCIILVTPTFEHYAYIHGVSSDEVSAFNWITDNYDTSSTVVYYFFAYPSFDVELIKRTTDNRLNNIDPKMVGDLVQREFEVFSKNGFDSLFITSQQTLELMKLKTKMTNLSWKTVFEWWNQLELVQNWQSSNGLTAVWQINIINSSDIAHH